MAARELPITARSARSRSPGPTKQPEQEPNELEDEWQRFVTQLPPEEAGLLLSDDVSRLCFAFCKDSHDKVRKKLAELNLSSLKQLALLKARARAGAAASTPTPKCDDVEFYEPMQYLDETTRELVLTIIEEKMEQLVSGNAPLSLMRALGLAPSDDQDAGNADGKPKPKSLRERLTESQDRADKLEEAKASAEKRLSTVRADLVAAQDVQRSHEAELRTANAQAAHWQTQAGRLASEIEAMRAEMLEQRSKQEFQRAELRRQRLELARQADRIVHIAEKEALVLNENDRLQARVGQLESDLFSRALELQVADEGLVSLKRQLADSEAQLHGLREENVQLRQLADVKEENKRLKAILEELQLKTRDLVRKLKKAGVDANAMCVDVGIDYFTKGRGSAFQRLYDDAMERIDRLQRLRENYWADWERQRCPPEIFIASRAVLEQALENSDLGRAASPGRPQTSPRPQSQASPRVTMIIAPPPLPLVVEELRPVSAPGVTEEPTRSRARLRPVSRAVAPSPVVVQAPGGAWPGKTPTPAPRAAPTPIASPEPPSPPGTPPPAAASVATPLRGVANAAVPSTPLSTDAPAQGLPRRPLPLPPNWVRVAPPAASAPCSMHGPAKSPREGQEGETGGTSDALPALRAAAGRSDGDADGVLTAESLPMLRQ